MADPIMVTAVATLVAWTTAELAQSGQAAVASLLEFLRDRFRREPVAREAIEGVLHQPSPDGVQRLAELLERETLRDPGFRTELDARLARIDAAVAAATGSIANSVSGDVTGSVVQARDVHGGISFGDGTARH